MNLRLALLILLFSACSNGQPPGSPHAETNAREQALRRTLTLVVEQVPPASQALRELIAREGGFVASSTEDERWANFEVRVPRDRLDAVGAAARDLGELVRASEETRDVTAAHRDLSAQLTTTRAEEARLLALMNSGTANLADVLAVERELTRVSTAIAQLEANERAMTHDVEMAQLSIDLREQGPPLPIMLGLGVGLALALWFGMKRLVRGLIF